MRLNPGARFGPYEIQSVLGIGGTGEVYRARDTHLNRDVAIKVLPSEFAMDGERLARFKREAQVLASLSHPNIASIYGFETSNESRHSCSNWSKARRSRIELLAAAFRSRKRS